MLLEAFRESDHFIEKSFDGRIVYEVEAFLIGKIKS